MANQQAGVITWSSPEDRDCQTRRSWAWNGETGRFQSIERTIVNNHAHEATIYFDPAIDVVTIEVEEHGEKEGVEFSCHDAESMLQRFNKSPLPYKIADIIKYRESETL